MEKKIENRHMSKELMTKFIEMYKKNTNLWKTGSVEYTNKDLKRRSYNNLIKLLQVELPNVDKDFIVKKINTIRCSFRKEYRKLMDNENYISKLWYFDMLLFTINHEDQDGQWTPVTSKKRNIIKNDSQKRYGNKKDIKLKKEMYEIISNNKDNLKIVENDDVEDDCADQNICYIEDDEDKSSNIEIEISENIFIEENSNNLSISENQEYKLISEQSNKPINLKKSKKSESKNSHQFVEIMGQNSTLESPINYANNSSHDDVNIINNIVEEPKEFKTLNKQQDEFDAIGYLVASKLRKIANKNEAQYIYCENVINQALMKAHFGKLKESSIITN